MSDMGMDGGGTPQSKTTGVDPLWGSRLAARLAPRSDHVRLACADGLAPGVPTPSDAMSQVLI